MKNNKKRDKIISNKWKSNKKGDKMSKELIANDIILFNLEAETKQEIIEKLTDAMDKDGRSY